MDREMRTAVIGLFLSGMLFAGDAVAYDAYNSANCNGIGWDDKRVLVVSAVTAKSRVNFVKSPYDDDFKAETCPSATDECKKKSYLVVGDLVLTGAARGEFTCVSYHSPMSTRRDWTTGWVPSSVLTPVAPMRSPHVSDWAGRWRQGQHYVGGGLVEIKREGVGKLHVDGGILLPTARDFHNGAFEARVAPQGDTLTFEDNGSNYGSECKVRMQRIDRWLLVEDNGGCGGAGVTFTGLYRRK